MKLFAIAYFFLGAITVAVLEDPAADGWRFGVGLVVAYLILGGAVVYSVVHGLRHGSVFDSEHRTFAVLAPLIDLFGLGSGMWLAWH